MLTFFHSPLSCSNGILLLLHDVGAKFETKIVDVRAGDHQASDYLDLNPKGKVPALRFEDGSVLTEFPAIALWLAESYPKAGLVPANPTTRARVIEALDYIVSSVHMRAFTFDKMPQKFISDPEAQGSIKAYGRAEVAKGLNTLSAMLGDKPYLLGDFSAADAALFYVLTWADLDGGYDIQPNLTACLARIKERPAYAKAAPLLTR